MRRGQVAFEEMRRLSHDTKRERQARAWRDICDAHARRDDEDDVVVVSVIVESADPGLVRGRSVREGHEQEKRDD